MTSTDPLSRSWDTQISNSSVNLRDVVFNGRDQIVVVGFNGTILTSSDGVNWVLQDSGTSEDIWGVEYDPAGLYVAVGTSGTILTSDNGIDWVMRTSPSGRWLRDVGVGKVDTPLVKTTSIPATPLWSILLSIAGVGWIARRHVRVLKK